MIPVALDRHPAKFSSHAWRIPSIPVNRTPESGQGLSQLPRSIPLPIWKKTIHTVRKLSRQTPEYACEISVLSDVAAVPKTLFLRPGARCLGRGLVGFAISE